MCSFSYMEPVCCSMSGSNCYFLTCIQISQEADQVVLYSLFFKNFPQFVVIHTVKDFGIFSKAEIDVFLELSCFFNNGWMLTIWSLVPLPFLKPTWTSRGLWFTYSGSLAWRILSIKTYLRISNLKTVRYWWNKSMTQIDGRIYHVLRLEESILLKWLYCSRQSTDSVQSLSNYQWHFSQI